MNISIFNKFISKCLEKARLTAYVIEARGPNMTRIPYHSAQVAENKTYTAPVSLHILLVIIWESHQQHVGRPLLRTRLGD